MQVPIRKERQVCVCPKGCGKDFCLGSRGTISGETPRKSVVGCVPASPSRPTFEAERARNLHGRGLLLAFARIIRETDPDVVSMGNVPQLQKERIFKKFVAKLRAQGYAVSYSNVDCREYGVPQSRTRLVLFASKRGSIELLPPTHRPGRYRTVRQTIGSLSRSKQRGESARDRLHRSSELSPLNLNRIRASRPGRHLARLVGGPDR